jgi:hypothetical protein
MKKIKKIAIGDVKLLLEKSLPHAAMASIRESNTLLDLRVVVDLFSGDAVITRKVPINIKSSKSCNRSKIARAIRVCFGYTKGQSEYLAKKSQRGAPVYLGFVWPIHVWMLMREFSFIGVKWTTSLTRNPL